MKCPNCKNEVSEDAKFCLECGAKLTSPNDTAMARLERMEKMLEEMRQERVDRKKALEEAKKKREEDAKKREQDAAEQRKRRKFSLL